MNQIPQVDQLFIFQSVDIPAVGGTINLSSSENIPDVNGDGKNEVVEQWSVSGYKFVQGSKTIPLSLSATLTTIRSGDRGARTIQLPLSGGIKFQDGKTLRVGDTVRLHEEPHILSDSELVGGAKGVYEIMAQAFYVTQAGRPAYVVKLKTVQAAIANFPKNPPPRSGNYETELRHLPLPEGYPLIVNVEAPLAHSFVIVTGPVPRSNLR